jgi:Fic family protein
MVRDHPSVRRWQRRVARAIADLALARSERSSQRFYSMSAQIRRERNDYYDILESTQKGNMDMTAWMEWFLRCLRAIDGAQTTLAAVLRKARFSLCGTIVKLRASVPTA